MGILIVGLRCADPTYDGWHSRLRGNDSRASAPAPLRRRPRSGDEAIASPSLENGVPMSRSARRHTRRLPGSAA